METALINHSDIARPLEDLANGRAPLKAETFKDSLDKLFPEQRREEDEIKKSKDILGDLAYELSSDQLKILITEVKFLTESWLDDFERNIFKGMTLQELLHENKTK